MRPKTKVVNDDRSKRFITRQEFLQILQYLKDKGSHYYLIYLMMGFTGLRVGEVVAIQLQDFFRIGDKFYLWVRQCKSERIKSVYLHPLLVKEIKAYIANNPEKIHKDGYIFSCGNQNNRNHKHMVADSITAFVARLRNDLGLLDRYDGVHYRVCNHSFRHFFVSNLYFVTENIMLVNSIIDHKKLKDTMRYTHLNIFDFEDAEIKAIKKAYEFVTDPPRLYLDKDQTTLEQFA